ncbi:DUF6850 family outer membrane beta-barrel protein [Sphingobacterium sp. SG20118]|uniref:DUF6850 family outer membrane beta-barrel protein n=1 Tax=Sphingobacterium sp. SG20118 TaxID=3367156 RepID=UPI0037DFC2D0
MKKHLWIWSSSLVLALPAKAQDSASYVNAYHQERSDLFVQERIRQMDAPSLRPFDYQQEGTTVQAGYLYRKQDKYNWQRGNGESTLSISSETYRKTNTGWTIWGDASYQTGKSKGLNYNESLDYDRIFPYFMADSVGGDQSQQSYLFGGGIAKKTGNWSYGAAAHFRANQASRQLDPRPYNRSAILDLDISSTYHYRDQYLVSAQMGYTMYKQSAALNFVSKLSKPTFYHLNGPAAYNKLLMDSESIAFYTINTFRGGLSIHPINTGWIASSIWETEAGSKRLKSVDDNINTWTDKKGTTQLGYHLSQDEWQWQVIAHWNSQRRIGTEALFTSQSSNNGLQKIADRSSYRYFQDSYGILIGTGKPRVWNLQLQADLSDIQEQYLSPYYNSTLRPLDLNFKGQYYWKAGKDNFETSFSIAMRKILEKDFTFRGLNENTGIGQLITNNWNYMQLEPVTLGINAQWNINSFEQLFPFIGIRAEHATAWNANALEIKVGFKF